MTAKAFYLAVGEIDDDLIQEAESAPAKPRRSFYRYLTAAACVCVATLALFLSRPRDDIRFNALPAPPAARVAVQGDAVVMTEAEAAAYYGLSLPETLGDLVRESAPYYIRYETADGGVSYDESAAAYQSADGRRSLTVSVSKAPVPSLISTDGAVYSRVGGTSVLLAATGEREPSLPSHWAEFRRADAAVRMTACGFSDDEFISVVSEMLRA